MHGDECARAKPFPEPYLEGMRLMGLRPEETLVVEDSPAGIRVSRPTPHDWNPAIPTTTVLSWFYVTTLIADSQQAGAPAAIPVYPRLILPSD